MWRNFFTSLFIFVIFCVVAHIAAPAAQAISINGQTVTTTGQIKMYEKYEVHFNVVSNSQYPFFEYDTAPPAGVSPGVGMSVKAIITSPSGKIINQPAFYMSEVTKSGNVYYETNKSYWAIRFSPQEIGQYSVTLSAQDASGTALANVGTFQAVAATRDGFIQVSQADKRYFEFSNGNLFFPLGPANRDPDTHNYNKYLGSGANLERPWLGGMGIYSSNWGRWKSSAEQLGNEGIQTRFSWREKYPGHDLSYEIFYSTTGQNGYRIWLTPWLDDEFGGVLKNGSRYQVKLVFKAANITGPRNSSFPYGFVVRHAEAQWGKNTPDEFDPGARPYPIMAPTGGGGEFQNSNDSRCASVTDGWCTYTTTFTANRNGGDFYLYLDNVTGGQVYVDEFSVKEINSSGTVISGEIIRNPRADAHSYVEQRPAAALDEYLTNAEQNGVFLKMVVHDKNDWIQNHLKTNGTWADAGDGYYQAENTKARWLLRQWYRYLTARWGYSTAVHTFELNNEGPPNEEGNGTAAHWRTAQAFAKYIHDIYPARRILATTSFWCCWRPRFWADNTAFPDIDYADLHMYGSNIENGIVPLSDQYDTALWTYDTSLYTYNNSYPAGKKGVDKPIMLAETGFDSGEANTLLAQANPGIWYHDMIWGQLNYGALSNPLYWHDQHLLPMTNSVLQQTKPLYLFTKDLDLNKGGYVNAAATSPEAKIRAWGQKNLSKNKAHLWIQNSDHTWKKVRDKFGATTDGDVSLLNTTVTVRMNPSTSYTVEWWNTYNGTKTTTTVSSNSSGDVSLPISNLGKDIAVKIYSSSGGPTPTSSPTTTPTACKGDINGDSVVDLTDYSLLVQNFLKSPLTNPKADFNGDGMVDLTDYSILVGRFLKPCAQ